MDCEKYLELMSAVLDGECSAEEHRELDSHLAVCPQCAELYHKLTDQTAVLRELDCEVPADLKARIMNNLPEQEKPVKAGKVIHWKRWAPVAAAACLVLVVTLLSKGAMKNMEAAAPSTPNAPLASPVAPIPAESPDELIVGGLYDPAPRDSYGHSESVVSPGAPSAPAEPPAPAEPSEPAAPSEPSAPAHYWFANQQAIRVSYGAPLAAPAAQIIGSEESLADYLTQFDIPVAALESLSETYTADYFQTHRLLCVTVEAGSGSYRYEIASQGLLRNNVTVLEIVPEVGTCDMAAWLIVAEVDSMFNDGDILNVLFERINA